VTVSVGKARDSDNDALLSEIHFFFEVNVFCHLYLFSCPLTDFDSSVETDNHPYSVTGLCNQSDLLIALYHALTDPVIYLLTLLFLWMAMENGIVSVCHLDFEGDILCQGEMSVDYVVEMVMSFGFVMIREEGFSSLSSVVIRHLRDLNWVDMSLNTAVVEGFRYGRQMVFDLQLVLWVSLLVQEVLSAWLVPLGRAFS